MEKKEFLKRLEEQLYARRLDEESVAAQLERVSNYIKHTGMKDIEADPAEMAEGIVKALGVSPVIENEGAVKTAASAPASGVPSVEDEINASLKYIGEEPSKKQTAGKPKGKNKAEPQTATAPKSTDEDLDPRFVRIMAPEDVKNDVPDDNIDDVRPYRPARNERDKKLMHKHNRKEYVEEQKEQREEQKKELSEADIQKLRNNKTLFTVLACIAAPFVLALALITVGLYVFFWVALALMLIFSIAGLIVFVAAGCCISLIGIVYGVIQLVAGETPIGLFEIGLGVIVIGSVLLIGILVYNFAMRLIPFAMKQLAKLFKFAFVKGKDAYITVKGVCEKL
jgi:uncharacterized membrane protein